MFKKISNRQASWRKILQSPAFVMLLVSSILLTFGLICVYKIRPFTSDDVFWQTILLRWQPFEGTLVTLGNSSVYVDKIPLYQIINFFLEPGRKALFLQSYIPAMLGFIGFYISSLYFLKKAGARLNYLTLLPFAWISSLGYSFVQLYLNPNWRGYQLGFSFILLALTAALWNKDINLRSLASKLILVFLVIYTGLQLYSDPFILYLTIAPLAIFAIIVFALRKISRRQFTITMISIIASYLFSKIFGIISASAGIRSAVDYPMQFIQFDKLDASIWSSLYNVIIVHSADFFGLKLALPAITPVLNFLVVLSALFVIYIILKKIRIPFAKVSLNSFWIMFFITLTILVFILHTISTMGDGTGTYRYFMTTVLIYTLLLAYFIGTNGRYKHILAGLLVLAVIGNIGGTLTRSLDQNRGEVALNTANQQNLHTIDLLENKGYTKGYANYWDASITSYLSQGKLTVLPSVCSGPVLRSWHWLSDDKSFNLPAKKTFYVFNPTATVGPCTVQTIESQLGQPSETFNSGPWKIYAYDYDISSRLTNYQVIY